MTFGQEIFGLFVFVFLVPALPLPLIQFIKSVIVQLHLLVFFKSILLFFHFFHAVLGLSCMLEELFRSGLEGFQGFIFDLGGLSCGRLQDDVARTLVSLLQ